MNIKKESDLLVFSIGQIVFSFLQFGIIIILNKMANTESVGAYALALSITTPVFTFFGLNLRAVLVSRSSIQSNKTDFVVLRCATSIAAFILILLYVTLFRKNNIENTTIYVISLYKFLESISDISYGFLQRKAKLRQIAVSMMLRSALIDILLIAALLLGVKAEKAFFVLPVIMLILLITIDFSSEYLKGSISLRELEKLLKIALPLGPVMMLNSLNINIPKYYIGGALGTKQLGVFSSISQVVFIGSLLTTSIGTTYSRSIAKSYSDNNIEAVNRTLIKMLALVAVIYISGLFLSCIAGSKILSVLFTDQYSIYSNLLNNIVLSYFFLSLASVSGYFLTALCEYKIQLVSWFLAVLVNIAICTQAYRFGMITGAYGLGVSSLVVIIINYSWYNKKIATNADHQNIV